MERDHARIAMNLCEQLMELHDALCEEFCDDFMDLMDLMDAEYQGPDFDDSDEDPI